MTTMVTEVCDALISAGAADDKARAAAAAIAVYDQSTIKADIAASRGETKSEFAAVRGDMSAVKTDLSALKTDVIALKTDVAVLKWGVGLALAILVSLAAKAFF